ncbi:MAG: prepilin-type N-terminal cleavage/methylation domain-containing protein [Bacillota bacterium]|jgi:prepilin-type N-terminal cleavage/methylation domain-containing protein|nr:prepilin-type N-terminal cleavage/methylation domain-containing protein [Bacillota bacterium]HOC05758.1 prepilin-type N-terminal cleavage/methylation domain-containing protein [Bacillota bacterium]HPZ21454.1 prepilin-type N-terminal cleavage/methylation domain-containing protein [Bacillota bacterium]HQD19316.1 prepilin-type N-terminal cleavage/methylation domain-containing protein [Bacillota bacterium]
MLRSCKGFTLMEILVVVTIIGILAAIAIPSYINAVEQGRRDACAANVHILFAQVERYRLTEGRPVPVDVDLVQFLKAKGYLTGEELQCPFASEEVKPEYKLRYQGQEATVYCSHCNPEQ